MNPRCGLQEHRAEAGPAPGPGSCQQMVTSAGPNLTPWGSSEPKLPTGPRQPVGLVKLTAGPLYAAVTTTSLLSETPPGCKRAESECSKSKWADLPHCLARQGNSPVALERSGHWQAETWMTRVLVLAPTCWPMARDSGPRGQTKGSPRTPTSQWRPRMWPSRDACVCLEVLHLSTRTC